MLVNTFRAFVVESSSEHGFGNFWVHWVHNQCQLHQSRYFCSAQPVHIHKGTNRITSHCFQFLSEKQELVEIHEK